MTIQALIKAVRPPSEPFEAFAGPWKVMEHWLGTALPQDYKDFVRLYGSGYFMEFLRVHVPHARNPNSRLEEQVRQICRIFAESEDVSPYPLWPDPRGLLPFGVTDNGDYLCWLPGGAAPENWRVVLRARGDQVPESFEEFDCGLTAFLAGLATGAITPKCFPDDFLPWDGLFIPYSFDEAEPVSQRSAAALRLRWRTQFAWVARDDW